MAIALCLINQKGGCGKSSTSFHLAGAWASAGLRVLLLDLDPQGSLSQGFFGSQLVEDLPLSETVATLFDDTAFAPSASQLIRETRFSGVSVVPANQHLARFNTPNPEQTGMMQYALRTFIRELSGFDIVMMDCPPNLLRCSWNGMVAADAVVIPVPPEDFGTQGLRAVHQAVECASILNPSLQHMSHLITRYDRRLLIHRSYAERLRQVYSDSVLSTAIPEACAFKVSLARRSPVEFDAPKSTAAVLTRQLSHEILDLISNKTAKIRVA